jgi:phosphopantothenoylcysteine decarboxylase/phosphopantothenate--cysteine ligase
MGAVVHVIAANVSESFLAGLEHENVDSAAELKLALEAQLGKFQLVVMAAAVADYRPAIASTSKIKRSETGENLELDLVANPDLLQAFVKELGKRQDKALVIGFAAETSDNLVQLARAKLNSKGCDFIVANDISSGEVFNSSRNSVTLVSSGSEASFSGTKYEVARGVLSHVSSKVVRTPGGDKI